MVAWHLSGAEHRHEPHATGGHSHPDAGADPNADHQHRYHQRQHHCSHEGGEGHEGLECPTLILIGSRPGRFLNGLWGQNHSDTAWLAGLLLSSGVNRSN